MTYCTCEYKIVRNDNSLYKRTLCVLSYAKDIILTVHVVHLFLSQYGPTVPASTLRAAPFTDSEVQFKFNYNEAEKVFTASHLDGMVEVTVSLAEFPPRIKVGLFGILTIILTFAISCLNVIVLVYQGSLISF